MKKEDNPSAKESSRRHKVEKQIGDAGVNASSRQDSDAVKRLHVSEVRQAELQTQIEKLKTAVEKAEKANLFYDFAPVACFTLDNKGTILGLNMPGASMLGKDRSKLIKKNLRLFIANERQADFNTFLQRVFETGLKQQCEINIADKKDGSRCFQLEGIVSAEQNECLVTAFDNTTQRIAENQLSESEEKFKQILENTGTSVLIIDKEGVYQYANEKAAQNLGLQPDQIVGKTMFDFLDYDTAVRYKIQNIKNIEEGKRRKYEDTFKLPTGTKTFLIIDYILKDNNGKGYALQSSSIDITERKLAEKALKESEEKYHDLLKNSSDVIWTQDLNQRITYMSENVEKYLGYTVDEYKSLSVEERLPAESVAIARKALSENVQKVINEKIDAESFSFLVEMPHRHKSGKLIWGELNCSFLLDGDKKIIGVHGITRDITAKKEAETVLTDSENKYRSLVEMSPSGIAIYQDGKFVFSNRAGLQIMGCDTQNELIGKPVLDFVHPDSKAEVIKRMKLVAGGIVVDPLEEKLLRLDGTYFIGEVIPSLTQFEGKPAGQIIVQDITNRKFAEEILREREKVFALMFEQAPLGYQSLDADGRFLNVNEAWLETLGYKKEEVVDKWFGDFLAPEFVEPFRKRFSIFKSLGKVHSEFEMMHKNGERRSVSFEGRIGYTPEGKFSQTHCILTDVTESRKAEDEIKAQYALLRIAGKTAKFGGWSLSLENKKVKWSDETAAIHEMPAGYSPDLNEGIEFYTPEYREKIQSVLNECILNGIPFDEELQIITAKKNIVWVRSTGEALRNDKGEITLIQGSFQDISDRKTAEAALKESQLKYSIIADNTFDWEFWQAPDESIIYLSPSSKRITGYDSQDFINDPGLLTKIIHPEDKHIFKYHHPNGRKDVNPATAEFRIIAADGSIKWIEHVCQPVFDNEGTFIGTRGSNRDVTSRKLIEEELAESEEKFRKAFTSSPAVAGIMDLANDRFLDINLNFTKVFGWERDEVIGKTPKEIDLYEYYTQRTEILARIAEQGSIHNYEVNLRTKTGKLRSVLFSADSLEMHGHKCLLTQVNDITDRKYSEEILQQSEEKYRLLYENMSQGAFYQLADGTLFDINPAGLEMFGLTRDQFSGRTSYHPDWKVVDEEHNLLEPKQHPSMRALHSGKEVAAILGVYNPLKKAYKWLSVDARPQFLPKEKKPYQVFVTMHDVTRSKLAEDALRHSEERFQAFMLNLPAAAFIKDKEGRTLYANKYLQELLDWKNWQGKTTDELIDSEVARRMMENDNIAFEKGTITMQENLVDSHGNPRVFETIKFPIQVSGEEVLLGGISFDITERNKYELEFISLNKELESRVNERTAKLQAAIKDLELFSYSASHEIRTPLRALNGYANILLEDYSVKLDDEGRRMLKVIVDNTIRMGQLIDDLLLFSHYRPQEIRFSKIDMNEIITSVYEEIISKKDKRDIDFRVQTFEPAQGNQVMVKQIWKNLIGNAVKFTSHSKTRKIEIGSFKQDNETVYFVKDNGVGFDMNQSNLLFGIFKRLPNAKEFDGSGVGLSIVKRIINSHKGRIWAEAAINEGATFYFTLGDGK
jgi:PAS domain S-box-containing protein